MPKIRRSLPYIVTAVCAILYFCPFLRVLSHSGDEGTLIMGAVRVANGQLPFRDFIEVMGPGTFYWLALFFKLLGTTWLATRICLLVTTTVIAVLLLYLARRLRCGLDAVPVIFFVAVSYHSWNAISHHMDSNLFALLSFAAFVSWMDTPIDKPRLFTLVLAGAGAGLTTWFILPKGILLFLAFALLLCIFYRQSPVFRPAFAALLGGFVAVNAAVLAWFWVQGGLPDLIYANLTWPLTNYASVNVVPYGWEFYQLYWSGFMAALKPIFSTAGGLALSSILSAPFLAVLGLPLVLLVCVMRFRQGAFDRTNLPYWIAGCAMLISEMHRKDLPHIVFGSPLLILLAFYYCRRIRGTWVGTGLQLLTACAVLLAVLNPLVALSEQGKLTTRRGVVYDASRDDYVLDYLEAHMLPGEPLFVYPYAPMYYFLTAAQNPTRYSILMYHINTSQQFREVIGALEETRVRYVVWDQAFPGRAKTWLPGYHIPAPDELVVEPYLLEHYRPVGGEAGGFQILERNEFMTK